MADDSLLGFNPGDLSSFGPNAATYGGLLNPAQQRQVAMQQIIGSLGAIGAAGQPSRLPVPLGAAFGHGAIAGQEAGNRAALQMGQMSLLAPEIQLKQLQAAQMAHHLQVVNDALNGTGMFAEPSQQQAATAALANGGGPTRANAAAMDNMTAGNQATPGQAPELGGLPRNVVRQSILADYLSPTTAKAYETLLQNDPNLIRAKTAAEMGVKGPWEALSSYLREATRPVTVGENQRVATGGQNIPGLTDLLNSVFRGAGLPQIGSGNSPPPQSAPPPTPSPAPVPAPGPSQGSTGAPSPLPTASALPAALQPKSRGPSQAPAGVDQQAWNEVPQSPLPEPPTRNAQGMLVGLPSDYVKMKEEANKQKIEFEDNAKGASVIKGQLKLLDSTLNSGQLNTSQTAPALAVISKWIASLPGGDEKLAKSVTGIDPAQAELFNKDATRLGLQFARNTEGAREAVAAIKIALGGNPTMETQLRANKMIVQIMDRVADHDIQGGNYANAFFYKNLHNVGFAPWWNQTHSEDKYVKGETRPYDLPFLPNGQPDQQLMLPDFVYRAPSGQIGRWNGKNIVPVQ